MSQFVLILCSFFIAFSLTGCSEQISHQKTQQIKQNIKKPNTESNQVASLMTIEINPSKQKNDQTSQNLSSQIKTISSSLIQKKTTPPSKMNAIHVIAKPDSIPVLVNKVNKLPDSYKPKDLVYTPIPFIFKGKSEKKEMRREAAAAISNLFTGALHQGVNLLGVSAYRSHITQKALFDAYVRKDGYAKARTYSALPGTSEHETGLAIDVTGGNGKCSAQDCFGGTLEAKWLQVHVADYGFIIRYPRGKEAITGYKYEPWHLRYVGKTVAKEIMSNGSTLEDYFNTIPVNK
jgi:zinc D-Ala-D-Ala carboxypeptidase